MIPKKPTWVFHMLIKTLGEIQCWAKPNPGWGSKVRIYQDFSLLLHFTTLTCKSDFLRLYMWIRSPCHVLNLDIRRITLFLLKGYLFCYFSKFFLMTNFWYCVHSRPQGYCCFLLLPTLTSFFECLQMFLRFEF